MKKMGREREGIGGEGGEGGGGRKKKLLSIYVSAKETFQILNNNKKDFAISICCHKHILSIAFFVCLCFAMIRLALVLFMHVLANMRFVLRVASAVEMTI